MKFKKSTCREQFLIKLLDDLTLFQRDYDCLDDKGDVDEDLLTLVIECFIFVRDFEDEESGKTLSLLFVDMYVENAKELMDA